MHELQSYRVILALAFTLVLSAFFIRPGPPYRIDITEKSAHNTASSNFYFDIDGDGISEKIRKYYPSRNKTSLIFYDSNGATINQINLNGRFPAKSDIYFGDFDNNNIKEVYAFTYAGDSLFLNIIDPYHNKKPVIITRLIDNAPLEDDEAKYVIIGGLSINGDNDPFREFYFVVSAAFALIPRNVYCYDINNDTVLKSPFAGTCPRLTLVAGDIDSDGLTELWGNVPGTGNWKEDVPHTDQKSWFMVYTHTLQYKFDPVGFNEHPVITYPTLINDNKIMRFAVFNGYFGTSDSLKNTLSIFSTEGKILKERNVENDGILYPGAFYKYNNHLYLHEPSGGLVLKYDYDLNLVRSYRRSSLEGQSSGLVFLGPDSIRAILIYRNNSVFFTILKEDHYLTCTLKTVETILHPSRLFQTSKEIRASILLLPAIITSFPSPNVTGG